MSCIRKQIVLRMPAEAVGVCDRAAYDRFEYEHPGVLDFEVNHLSYSLGNNSGRLYFDYILYDSPLPGASALDSYWRARPLTGRERQRYLPVFRQLYPIVDMSRARYCEYVWYDGTDAPECILDEREAAR